MQTSKLPQICKELVSRVQGACIDLGAAGAGQKIDEQCELMGVEDVAWRQRLLQEFTGRGPLEAPLNDPSVTEILVNGLQEIWVERAGRLEKINDTFLHEYTLDRYVRRLLAPLGRKLDRKSPLVDGRLSDGSRICVAVSPAVLGGTHIAIRKFQRQWRELDALVASGFLSAKAKELLLRFVREKKNILISGATGTGKTSLLNAVAAYIPGAERVITIEDTAELELNHSHVVRMEARPANLEGEGEISIRALVRAAMRMRPDRLVLGECRGEEALDVLQAFNTGHGGSFTTVHANSPRDALNRLELLSLLNCENVSSNAIKFFVSSAIHAVVHIERKDGRRFVQSIQELKGMEDAIYLLKNHEI